MTFTVRAGTPDDIDQIVRLDLTAFHEDPDDKELAESIRLVLEPGRSLLAHDGDELVGHVGAFSRQLTVPGNVIPAAFVTLVGVAGTHRRQGVASTLVKQQLRDVRELGESVAILWASEGRIYQRFGYGLASRRLNLLVENVEVRLNAPVRDTGRLRAGSPDDLRDELVQAYEAVRSTRPGMIDRTDTWWDRLLADPPARRHGGGPRRAVIHEAPGGIDGYAIFRVKSDWNDSGPNGEVNVWNLAAANPDAYAALWQFLMNVDLTRRTTFWSASLDEPIQHLVNEPRRLGGRIADAHWVRLVDVPAALASRRYPVPVDLVFEVTDELMPENAGRFRLTGNLEKAGCEPTGDPADLALDVSALGALYLGGTSLGALAAGGRATELSPGALALANAAFGWQREPAAIEIF